MEKSVRGWKSRLPSVKGRGGAPGKKDRPRVSFRILVAGPVLEGTLKAGPPACSVQRSHAKNTRAADPALKGGGGMIVFPTTSEAFITYQEQLAGRELSKKEKEVTAAWVEVFNLSYEDGLEKDHAALDDSLTILDELAGQQEAGSAVHRFLQAARQWIIYAWEQGAEKGERTGG